MAPAAKPSSSTGGKAKKKKWSKGKTKEKAEHAVIVDKPTYDKIMKEVPTYKLITIGVMIDRHRVNGSLARRLLNEMESKGLITKVSHHAALPIYTRATAATEEVKTA